MKHLNDRAVKAPWCSRSSEVPIIVSGSELEWSLGGSSLFERSLCLALGEIALRRIRVVVAKQRTLMRDLPASTIADQENVDVIGQIEDFAELSGQAVTSENKTSFLYSTSIEIHSRSIEFSKEGLLNALRGNFESMVS